MLMADRSERTSVDNSNTPLWPEQITFSEKIMWRGRSRCLAFAAVLFMLAAVAFITAFLVVFLDVDSSSENSTPSPQTPTSTEEICTTDDCLETAAFIASSIDSDTDPCEDFYQFACGKWMASHSIDADETHVTPRGLADRDTVNILKEALTEDDPTAPDAVKKARIFFRSCENTDAMDARGAKPLKDLLQSGGDNLFPTLSPGWTEAGLSFSELVERITAVGGLNSAPFISVQVAVDIRESTSAIIKIDQQYTLLAPLLYLNARTSTVLSKYQDVYAQILTLLGANETVARDDAVDVVNFETEIAKILESPHSRANETAIYIKMTIGNLTERYPQFDWYGHLETLFAEANVSITEDEVVVNTALGYFDKLFDLVSSTPERTLLNYGMWRITWPLVGLTSKQLRDAKGSFIRSMQGTTRSPSRREQCVEVTMKYFPYSVGRLYIERKNFTQRARNRLEEMAANLLEAFKEIVRESDWMSNTTKQAALEKADSMKYKIGYPDFIMNDTWLDERYKNFAVSENTFFQNSINIFLENRIRHMETLRKPVDDTRWAFSAASSSAGHVPTRNEIEFPAGLLQSPYFSDSFPDAINYGAIGSLIGHEITHGYDVSGRLYDKNGNLATWWQPEDVQKFVQRAQCMLDQYANFTDPALNTKVNGLLTLSENIADNGGIKEAFKAYRRTVTERGKEEARLPVIPYTPDQLFFVGFAQIWCGNYRDKYRAVLLHMDVHSPHRFRVLGALQNNPDFARVFDCPTGSPMNPGRKCHVW